MRIIRKSITTWSLVILILITGCTPIDAIQDDLYTINHYPAQTNVYNLGSATYQWNNLWVTNINGAPFGPGGAAHNILSVTHSDSTAAAVVRGDLITGQGIVPKWSRLALGGVGTFLKSDGTDIVWGAELDPVWGASPSFGITALDIAGWNALVSSQWITDINGINYIGNVGIHTTSSATGLLTLYSSDGISNDPILGVTDNSASDEAVGIRVNMTGAKTDYTDGIYITNASTSVTAGSDKYGLRIRNTGAWGGVGSTNWSLYIETPTGGTANYSIYSEGGPNYLGGTLTLGTPLAIGDGGTGQITKAAAFDALSPMTTLGDMISGGAVGTGTRLVGDTSDTRKFLRELSVGGVATAPAWDTIQAGDVPFVATGYIPYTGATGNINLNAREVTNTTLNNVVLKGTFTPSGNMYFGNSKWVEFSAAYSGAWYNATYSRMLQLTLDNTAGAASTTNAVVYVSFTAANFDYSQAKIDGSDVIFVNTDNLTLLTSSIVTWSVGGTSTFKVTIPTLTNTNYVIYCYWGTP